MVGRSEGSSVGAIEGDLDGTSVGGLEGSPVGAGEMDGASGDSVGNRVVLSELLLVVVLFPSISDSFKKGVIMGAKNMTAVGCGDGASVFSPGIRDGDICGRLLGGGSIPVSSCPDMGCHVDVAHTQKRQALISLNRSRGFMAELLLVSGFMGWFVCCENGRQPCSLTNLKLPLHICVSSRPLSLFVI